MLNISAAIKYGWEKFKKMPGYLIGLILIIYLIMLVPSVLQGLVGKVAILSFAVAIASIILQLIVCLGVIKMLIAIYNGSKPAYGTIFDEMRDTDKIVKLLLAGILYGLIIFAGTLLFIIPGIIWAIKYRFFPFFIYEKNAGVWESLDMSGKLTMGNKWNIFGLDIVMGIIILISMIPLGLGLLVTMPMAMLISVYVYKTLSVGKDLKTAAV